MGEAKGLGSEISYLFDRRVFPLQLIRMGSKGRSVRFLQQRLNVKGFHVVEDGLFGLNTDRAVRQLQASCSLVVDGLVGDNTWDRLLSEGEKRVHAVKPSKILTEPLVAEISVAKPEMLQQIDDLSAMARHALGKSTLPMRAERLSVLLAGIVELGKQEQPEGSNGGPEIRHIVEPGGDGLMPSDYTEYWRWAEPSGKLPLWCGIFVSYCLLTGLGAKGWDEIPFGSWFGGAQQIEDWGKERGSFHRALILQSVASGSIFSMNRGGSTVRAGHAGLVIADDIEHVITIEGNISNGVWSRRRRKDSLRGVIYWW